MGEWIVTLLAVFQTYLAYKQNEIFKKQNEIFEYQAGKEKPDMSQNSLKVIKIKRYWPMVCMALLMLASWISVAFSYYEHVYDPLPIVDFDQPQSGPALQGYGQDGSTCFGIANGAVPMLAAHGSNYKVAIACFLYDGKEDILDAREVQVSRLYDLKQGDVNMRLDYSKDFQQYRAQANPIGIDVALLLVPIGTDISQFATLREARNGKVHILSIGAAAGVSLPQQPKPTIQ